MYRTTQPTRKAFGMEILQTIDKVNAEKADEKYVTLFAQSEFISVFLKNL